jgi:hypothetical protein
MASNVRAVAFRSKCLSLANACSMGFRSGEYFGRMVGAGLLKPEVDWRAAFTDRFVKGLKLSM